MARSKSTGGSTRKSAAPRAEPPKAARRSTPPSGTALTRSDSRALVKTPSAASASSEQPTKPKRSRSVAPSSNGHNVAPYPSQEAIAARAYELYVQSGYQNGHDEEHWLQAERELREMN
jgi:hypothetical protein